MARTSTAESKPAGLYLIGIYKLIEGSLLALAGFGVLHLMHRDLQTVLLHWVHVVRADPDNHYIHSLLQKAFAISPRQLRELSVGTFVYAALRYAEGIGLVLRKAWGEYLTVIVTGLFIPLEVLELARHVTILKIAVFAINVATVIYLVYNLRRRIVKSH